MSDVRRDEYRAKYQSRLPLLETLAMRLDQETRASLDGVGHIDRVSFRCKGIGSFLEKVCDRNRSYTNPFNEVEDQVAGRVIVFFLSDIDLVEERLLHGRTFNPVETTIKAPKADDAFGYESRHFICNIPPHMVPDGWTALPDPPTTFELQLRTIMMHAWAEPQHDLGYKGAEDLPVEIRRELAWVAASAWGADQAYYRILTKIGRALSSNASPPRGPT